MTRLAPVPLERNAKGVTTERTEWSKQQNKAYLRRKQAERAREVSGEFRRDIARIVGEGEARERGGAIVRAGIARAKGEVKLTAENVQTLTEGMRNRTALPERLKAFETMQEALLIQKHVKDKQAPTTNELKKVEFTLTKLVAEEKKRLESEITYGLASGKVPLHDPLLRSQSAANLIGLWNTALRTEAGSAEEEKASLGAVEWRSIWKIIPSGAYIPKEVTSATLGKKPRRNIRVKALLPKTGASVGSPMREEQMPAASERVLTKPTAAMARSTIIAFLQSPLSGELGLPYMVKVPRNKDGAVVRIIGEKEED